MLKIFKGQCTKMQYLLSLEAEEAALAYLSEARNNPTFGNARGVRNFFDHIITNQASRILTLNNPSDVKFKTLKADDIYI